MNNSNTSPQQRLAGLVALLLVSGGALLFLRLRPHVALKPATAPAVASAPPSTQSPLLIQENNTVRPMTAGDGNRLYQKTKADLEKRPKDAQLHMQMAMLLSMAHRFDETDKEITKAVSLAPNDPQILTTAGLFYVRFGDMETALRYFQKARAIEPTSLDAALQVATVLSARGEMNKIVNLAADLRRTAGDSASRQAALAKSFTEFNLRQNAVEAWKRVLELDPKNAEALRELGYIDVQGGNLVAARKKLEASLALEPNSDIADIYLGTACALDKPTPENLRQAEAYLKKAIASGQDKNTSVHYYLGKTYQRQGNLPAAAEEMERVLALDPSSRMAHYDSAQIYAQLHRPDDAKAHREAFQKIYEAEDRHLLMIHRCRQSPNDPQIQYSLADLYESEHNMVKALPHYQMALELKPGWAAPKQKLIALYRQMGLTTKSKNLANIKTAGG